MGSAKMITMNKN